MRISVPGRVFFLFIKLFCVLIALIYNDVAITVHRFIWIVVSILRWGFIFSFKHSEEGNGGVLEGKRRREKKKGKEEGKRRREEVKRREEKRREEKKERKKRREEKKGKAVKKGREEGERRRE